MASPRHTWQRQVCVSSRHICWIGHVTGKVGVCGTFTLRALQFVQPLRDFLWTLYGGLSVPEFCSLSLGGMPRRVVISGGVKWNKAMQSTGQTRNELCEEKSVNRKRTSERAAVKMFARGRRPEGSRCDVERKRSARYEQSEVCEAANLAHTDRQHHVRPRASRDLVRPKPSHHGPHTTVSPILTVWSWLSLL